MIIQTIHVSHDIQVYNYVVVMYVTSTGISLLLHETKGEAQGRVLIK